MKIRTKNLEILIIRNFYNEIFMNIFMIIFIKHLFVLFYDFHILRFICEIFFDEIFMKTC